MSPFIRKYSRYINEKALAYRTVAFDFCKVKRGWVFLWVVLNFVFGNLSYSKDDGVLRTMSSEKLLKTLPTLQSQLDALLEFDCTANDLTNGVISMCFMLLFKDLIRLFACYNDGIINLLGRFRCEFQICSFLNLCRDCYLNCLTRSHQSGLLFVKLWCHLILQVIKSGQEIV